MADLSITAANVDAAAGAVEEQGTAGATVTAGQVVYQDVSDSNKWKLADADALASAAAKGIALHGASDDQPLRIIVSGDLNPGATVVIGEVYCVSDTAGGIKPVSDLASTEYVTPLGIGTTAANIAVQIQVSGVAKP